MLNSSSSWPFSIEYDGKTNGGGNSRHLFQAENDKVTDRPSSPFIVIITNPGLPVGTILTAQINGDFSHLTNRDIPNIEVIGQQRT